MARGAGQRRMACGGQRNLGSQMDMIGPGRSFRCGFLVGFGRGRQRPSARIGARQGHYEHQNNHRNGSKQLHGVEVPDHCRCVEIAHGSNFAYCREPRRSGNCAARNGTTSCCGTLSPGWRPGFHVAAQRGVTLTAAKRRIRNGNQHPDQPARTSGVCRRTPLAALGRGNRTGRNLSLIHI